MTLRSAFAGVAQFLFPGSLAALTFDARDAAARREGDIRSYAERAVWLTHFLRDPQQIAAEKAKIIPAGEIHGITVAEVNDYLRKHLDDLPLHGASPNQRSRMLSDMRQHDSLAAPAPALTFG